MPDARFAWTAERKFFRHQSARGNWRVFLYVWGGDDAGWVQRDEQPKANAAECDATGAEWLAGTVDPGPVNPAGFQESLFMGLRPPPTTG
jgi:hypothetical protein